MVIASTVQECINGIEYLPNKVVYIIGDSGVAPLCAICRVKAMQH